MSDLDQKIVKFKDSMSKAGLYVDGDAFTDVQTLSGPVPTIAKQARTATERLDGFVPVINNRLRIDGEGGYSPNQQAWGRSNIGLNKVDNTADVEKPLSQPMLTALGELINDINERQIKSERNVVGGYFGYDGARLPLRNGADNLFGYLFHNSTGVREWQLPDTSGIIALRSDITGINSGVNTGDETAISIRGKLNVTTLSGSNTGDETTTTIHNKLGITTISGVNTGDETRESIIEKITYDVMPLGARNAIGGVAPLDVNRKIPVENLPPQFNSIEIVTDISDLPTVGVDNRLYIATNTTSLHFWFSGSYRLLNDNVLRSTNQLAEGSNNLYFTQLRAISSLLSNYVVQDSTVVDANDSVVMAIGKLQGQINNIITGYPSDLSEKENISNKAVNFGVLNDTLYPTVKAVKILVDVTKGDLNTTIQAVQNGAATALNNAVDDLTDNLIEVQDNMLLALANKESVTNRATDFSAVNHVLYPTVQAVKTYADALVVGLVSDRGNYDASSNAFPTTGGSGASGAIKKGNLWYVSVAGTLGGVEVNVGDSFRAMVDDPGQTEANWAVLESNLGYVPYNSTNPAGYISSVSMTGDVNSTGSGSAVTVTIASRAVTFGKMPAVSTATIMGRSTAGSGDIEALSVTTAKSILGLDNVSNTSDGDKPVSTAQAAAIDLKEDTANKVTDFTTVNNTKFPTTQAVKSLVDTSKLNTLIDCGTHNASSNAFPTAGGTGEAGAIARGNVFRISVAGTLGGVAVKTGDQLRALTDTPAQDASKWELLQYALGFTPLNKAGDTLTGPLNFAISEDVASATNLNLNGASGNLITLTGTTNLLSITLAAGALRWVKFAGSLVIVHTTFLTLPSKNDVITQAGDYACFAGRADGGVDCVYYLRASGKALVASSNGKENVRSFTVNTAATTVDINAPDEATVFKATISANSTITFDNPPDTSNGSMYSFTLITINDGTGGRAVAFGNAIKWSGGNLPPRTTAANAMDIWTFFVMDGVYYGSLAIADAK